ncbi:uncharacterized protein [Solanum tuberosum]|uniref:uncharacterized protein n=1 Tax=Solanum tuberosum TaxID=4113 RepID=UPI00073A4E00|nr:PREDICTED: uncharacterized protein LOC107062661 [Solanum tuberosum]
MAVAVSEIIWLLGVLKELNVHMVTPVTLYCDNKAAIQIVANSIFHERTKYIEIDCHVVRERIKSGLVHTEYISTKEQLVDLLTKGLGSTQHHALLDKLGEKKEKQIKHKIPSGRKRDDLLIKPRTQHPKKRKVIFVQSIKGNSLQKSKDTLKETRSAKEENILLINLAGQYAPIKGHNQGSKISQNPREIKG